MPPSHPSPALTPEDIAHLARRAGLPLPEDRLAGVAATVNTIDSVLSTLRTLPLSDTPPASVFTTVPRTTHSPGKTS
ncbi:hypothetical protein [Streptomyces chrestomyceticus]|uniref:hypothetical protein n=1 Tax=Streptomyces chrestomyceticus TaxID=68185 RepID=UPI000AA0A555